MSEAVSRVSGCAGAGPVTKATFEHKVKVR
jgi:hypothetical protein